MMLRRARAILFAIAYYPLSVVMVLAAPIAALFGKQVLRAHCNAWAGLLPALARIFLGITTRIEGEIPRGPYLFAAKHESLFEAMDLTRMLGAPATVMKRELASIPLWGWATRQYGVIVIDRSGSAKALRQMMTEAKVAREEGRPVLIFPEGTRVPVGERAELRAVEPGKARALGLAVVPVAVDSGRVWPLDDVQRPGVITYRFGEPIPPGLPRAEIEARVVEAINALNAQS